VVTLADEFPTNIYPWLNLASRGVQTRRVSTAGGRLDLNRLAEACNVRTRIVAISWVGYSTGFRHDLQAVGEIARRHGARMLVDAIQGLGVFPLSVNDLPVDYLAADGHKWMLGPEGAGLLYIRRERLDELRPLGVGWHSVVRAYDYAHIDFRLKRTASRYEGGSFNCAGFLGLGGSLKLLLDQGIERIAERVLAITDLCCERLTSLGARIVSHRDGEHRSGIVAFEVPGRDPASVRRHCLGHGVALSCRAGLLRISPHAYNNADDIERLVEVLSNA
jgi:selenocysteine lyase/cysteine desulfurase